MNDNLREPSSRRGMYRCVAGIIAQGKECQKRSAEFRSSNQREMAESLLERAIKHYSDAIRIDPTHSASYLLRARAFEEQGDDERAEADLLKAQLLNGSDA